jgi:UDP-N-acetylmuramyl pentapeptide phosphotransferase/UDP-N-acetylglucosamine-1-phosphate transferase
MSLYYIFILLFIFTYFLNYFLIKKNLFLDSKKISKHKTFAQSREKVSYVGGFIILLGCIFFWGEKDYNFIIFSSLIFILGIFSDLGLMESPLKRFILQSLAILSFLILYKTGISSIRIELIDYLIQYKAINLLFTTFCILIVINGSNFMDGVNTLTAGYFLLVLISLLLIFFNNQNILLNFDLIIITTISLFVVFVFNIFGKIYLGDNGAYLIAFIVSIILIDASKNNILISPYYVVNLLWYPAFENFFSIIRKAIQKKSPMEPDNEHLHQLLFSYFKKIKGLNKTFANSLTACVINFFNLIIFTLASLNYSYTKIQILIILISLFFYNFCYFALKKINIKINYETKNF